MSQTLNGWAKRSKERNVVSVDELTDYLANELNVDVADIAPDTELFSSGLVDSFAMIDLISFVEQKCSIRLSASEITLDNFDSIDRVTSFLENRLEKG